MTNFILTNEWVEISTTSCLFQKMSGDDVAIFYGSAPSAGESIFFIMSASEPQVLPAPLFYMIGFIDLYFKY